MNFNELHFQKSIQAICLTLIHSLWQGLIVAVLAGLLVMLTKKAKPALRYNLLAALLFVFAATAAYTFFSLLGAKGVGKSGLTDSFSMKIMTPSHGGISQNMVIPEHAYSRWVADAMDFCSSNAQIIVAGWFLIFAFKSLQATAGFMHLQNVKKYHTHPLRKSWQPRFQHLANQLKINKLIQVVESEHVLVPMVIGFLKPMVIIPFGIFTALTEAQIEAIILHELAHIKRRDYLVNLIQIFCENVFFFNPALLWLSSLIKEEREHCCDDLAISVMENKTSLVHALVSFQEYHVKGTVFEMTFTKKRNHLLDRIKRIIYNNNKPLNAMEKLFVTFGLLAAVALSAAISRDTPPSTSVQVVQANSKPVPASVRVVKPNLVPVVNQDTLPKKKAKKTENNSSAEVHISENISVNTNINSHSQVNVKSNGISTYSMHINDKDYELVKINGKITALLIDGKEIPEDQFPSYQKEIDEALKKIEEEHDKAEVLRAQSDQLREEADKQRELADAQRAKADKQRELSDENRKAAEDRRTGAEKRRLKQD